MRRITSILVVLLTPFLLVGNVFAQITATSGVATNIEVAESVVAGDILTGTAEGIKRAAAAYDTAIIGVVSEFPVVSVGERTENTVALVSSGRANVRVSTLNGAIEVGDLITSSQDPGVGQKATVSGYVLGRALSSYDDTSQVGQIAVMVEIAVFNPSPSPSDLVGSFLSFIASVLQDADNFPLILRYISASVIGFFTFLFTFISFIRFMRSGLEAIGRNPLAKASIIAGMALNGAVVLVLAIAGAGIAVAIIAL